MSILGRAAAATQDVAGGELLTLVILFAPAAVAIAVAYFAGAFRRRGVAGPPRVDDTESLGTLVVLLGMGVILLIMAQALCLMPGVATAATTAPTTKSAAQSLLDDVPKMALISSVPPMVAFVFLVAVSNVLRPGRLRGLGLSAAQFLPGVVAGLVGSLVMIPLVFTVSQVTELVWRAVHYTHPAEHDLLRGLGESQNPWIAAVLILSAVLVAPLFEETLFRGHLQTLLTYMWVRLRRRPGRPVTAVAPAGDAPVGEGVATSPPVVDYETVVPAAAFQPQPWMRWLSIVVTSALFASFHPAWSIPPIFFLAICLGYAYERTGNLWTTITMHALFNTTSTVLFLWLIR